MLTNLIVLFIVFVGSMLPLMIAIREYRQHCDRGSATAYFFIAGPFAIAFVSVSYWGILSTVSTLFSLVWDGKLPVYWRGSAVEMIVTETLIGGVYTTLMCCMAQVMVLPAFALWRVVHRGSFESSVRHRPKVEHDLE